MQINVVIIKNWLIIGFVDFIKNDLEKMPKYRPEFARPGEKKVCKQCGIEKPMSAFANKRNKKTSCKDCCGRKISKLTKNKIDYFSKKFS
jgi:hypothetical protein